MNITLELNNLWQTVVDNQADLTLITVNRRTTNELQRQFDQWQTIQGKTAWQTADIIPLNAWIERVWQRNHDTRILLTPAQELVQWQQIIQQSTLGDHLLCSELTAQNVQQAWRLMQQWLITANTLKNYTVTPETQAFEAWIKTFKQICQEKNFITTAELMTVLASHKDYLRYLPSQLLFVGFNQIEPQLENLCTVLQQQGKLISFVKFPSRSHQHAVIALSDQNEEMITMARWAHQCLSEGKTNIACIVPNLADLRPAITRIFTEIFTPLPALPEPTSALPFNISLGKKFGNYPLIYVAFMILQLNGEANHINKISQLLRSTLIGHPNEYNSRALLDKKLHELGNLEISLRTVLSLSKDSQSPYYCPLFAVNLEKFISLIPKRSSLQLPSEWLAEITHSLQALGWPGQRSLQSDEFQILQRWQELLIEFASLDLILGKISGSTTVSILQNLANKIIFQSKSEHKPIQILGTLEAAGLPFDAIWMANMNEASWPPRQSANPFIPLALQRSLQIPNADKERSRQFYQDILQNFCDSTPLIIFSYFKRQGDEELVLTPVLQSLPSIKVEDLKLSDLALYDDWQMTQHQTEPFTDPDAPPLQPTETIQQGSHVIKQQAACPFQAFAKIRLGSYGLNKVGSGLNSLERGALLHHALETVWNRINDQHQLLQLNENELKQFIDQALQQSLALFITKKPLTFKKNFTAIEHTRLYGLILQWLNYEKTRSYFKVIAQEQPLQIKLGELSFHLRVDRIDQLSDGTYIIIDYKTGLTNIHDWLTARPNEPQLPMYYLANHKALSGLTFAQVRPNAMYFNGIVQKSDSLPDSSTLTEFTKTLPIQNWEELNAYWQNNLTQLAIDFCAGKSTVDPKEGATTCRYCDLKTLCRIYEQQ